MTSLQQFRTVRTTTANYSVTLTDRENIMSVLANPGEHGTEVREAIRVLIAAGRSTADPLVTWRRDTSGMGSQFQNLIDLVNDTLLEVDGADVYCLHADVPQYVPANWADTLNVRAVEDTEFSLPWLKDL